MSARFERLQNPQEWQFTFGQEVAGAKGITPDFIFRLYDLARQYGQVDEQSDTPGPKPTKLKMTDENGRQISVNLGEGSLAVLIDGSFSSGTLDVIKTTTGFYVVWGKDVTTHAVTKAMEKFGADLAKVNP